MLATECQREEAQPRLWQAQVAADCGTLAKIGSNSTAASV